MMKVKKEERTKVDELKDALAKKKQAEETIKKNAATGADSCPGLDDLTKQLETAEEEAKAHYDKLLRAVAELDNFKKRSEREKQELIKFSNENLIKDLIVVLDDLDRVLDHVPSEPSEELMNFVSGVELVKKHMLGALAKYGLQEIPAADALFDPQYHEAIAHIPSSAVPPGHVTAVHRKGYSLNGRVIRAATVSVSKGDE